MLNFESDEGSVGVIWPLYSPRTLSILKVLAVHKENSVEYIKKSPVELKRGLIIEALDNLGGFVRVQRGLYTPRLGHGTLKQLENISLTMN